MCIIKSYTSINKESKAYEGKVIINIKKVIIKSFLIAIDKKNQKHQKLI